MSTIIKGMVVELISDGPKMAVVDVSDYSDNGGPKVGAKCTWIDAKGLKHEEVFDVAVLKEFVKRPMGVRVTRA
jgi:uncharacterized protein YodC (DUF2158 family)